MSGPGNSRAAGALALEPRLQALLEQDYPRFSDAEFARRRLALAQVLAKHGCDHCLVCGESRAGTGVQWLTGWPITTEAIVIFAPGSRELMFNGVVQPLAPRAPDRPGCRRPMGGAQGRG